jgi:hypothetical protein
MSVVERESRALRPRKPPENESQPPALRLFEAWRMATAGRHHSIASDLLAELQQLAARGPTAAWSLCDDED